MSFWTDLKKRELLPIKILMFLIHGAQATLYPFFTLHLKSLGISIEQTSVIFAVQPVIALIVAPMVGMMADKIGNFKFLFCFFLVFSAISANCLLSVPEVKYSSEYGNLFMNMTCAQGADSQNQLRMLEESTCILKQNNLTFMELEIKECETLCEQTTPVKMCLTNSTLCTHQEFNYTKVTIEEGFYSSNDTITVNSFGYLNTTYKYIRCTGQKCDSICSVQAGGPDICKEKRKRIESSEAKTFWTYLGIRLMVTLGIGLVNGLFDSASIAVIMKHDADVGYQKMWATFSMCVFAPLSGYLADWTGQDGEPNYKPCFYLYGALFLFSAIIALFVDLSMKMPSQKAFKSLQTLCSNPELIIMLFYVSALGIAWGFLENFLFWFLESELKASTLLMGFTVTIGSGCGLPIALVSTWITKKIGYVNVIVVAFAAYCVRYIGYSFAANAYICLIYEMMEVFSVTLPTIGMTLYCAYLAPLEMLTTMMTLVNGLHVISGRAFGSLIGGFLMAKIGSRRTFRIFAYSCAAFCVSYFVVNILYLKRRQKPKKVEDEEEEMKEVRARALSVSSIIINYSTDNAYMPLVNVTSIISTRCRRHTFSSPQNRNSISDIELTKRHSQSLSFVPTSNPTVEPRRHVARKFSVMSYTSHLEPVPEEQSKCNSVEDFSLADRGEPEGSETPSKKPEQEILADNDLYGKEAEIKNNGEINPVFSIEEEESFPRTTHL